MGSSPKAQRRNYSEIGRRSGVMIQSNPIMFWVGNPQTGKYYIIEFLSKTEC